MVSWQLSSHKDPSPWAFSVCGFLKKSPNVEPGPCWISQSFSLHHILKFSWPSPDFVCPWPLAIPPVVQLVHAHCLTWVLAPQMKFCFCEEAGFKSSGISRFHLWLNALLSGISLLPFLCVWYVSQKGSKGTYAPCCLTCIWITSSLLIKYYTYV